MDVAVIGGGVSGLYTAQQIASKHQVTIFEQEAQLGGHAHTVSVNLNQDIIDVDMGFIVCNDRNYPLFNQWLEELNVQRIKSDMSFGVNDLKNDIIWSSNAPFGQTKNWFRWRHYQMFLDIISFFRKAEAYVAKNPDARLKTMVNDLGRGAFWWQHFLYPMAASIWSTSFQDMDDFPAAMLVTFFQNHGLMSLINHPQWYTIQGGSCSYVQAACQQMSFKKMSGASRVRRQGQHVLVMDNLGQEHRFDQVFFAVHPSIIRHITVDLYPEEDAILRVFKTSKQHVVLHQDIQYMPKIKSCWSSWNYLATENTDRVAVTYWMNRLQPFIQSKEPILVTLNPDNINHVKGVLAERFWSHPMFTPEVIQAQQAIRNIQGHNQCWYVGAYLRYGFHEDGLWSVSQIMPKWQEQEKAHASLFA